MTDKVAKTKPAVEKPVEKTTPPVELKVVPKKNPLKPAEGDSIAQVAMEAPKRPFQIGVPGDEDDHPTPHVLEAMQKEGITEAKFKNLLRPMGNFGRSTRSSTSSLYTPKLSEIDGSRQYTRTDFETSLTGFWVMGVKLLPIHTGIRKVVPGGRRGFGMAFDMDLGLDPTNNYFSYRIPTEGISEDTEFDVYQFEVDGKYYTYMLSGNSKVWIKEDTLDQLCMPWHATRRQLNHNQGAGVVLINAQLFNCSCYNAVRIFGGRHFNSLFSDSFVDYTPENKDEGKVRPYHLPWGETDGEAQAEKQKLRRVYLERANVTRSELPAGQYFSSNFTDSRIDCANHVQTETSYLTKAKLKAVSSVSLYAATLTDFTLTATDSIQIGNQTLKDAWIEVDSIFAPNKLCFSVFDNPYGANYRSIRMIMCGRDVLELQGGIGNQRLKIKTWKSEAETRDEVDAWVTKALGQYNRWNDDPEAAPTTPTDLITKSMIQYITDNIMSRLAILKTAMQAIEIGRNLEGRDTQELFNYY